MSSFFISQMENTPQEEQQPQSTVEEEVCECNLTQYDAGENCHQEKPTGYWMPPCGPCHKGRCCYKRDHFRHHGNFDFPMQQPIYGFFIPCQRGPCRPPFGPWGPCVEFPMKKHHKKGKRDHRPPFAPPFGMFGPCSSGPFGEDQFGPEGQCQRPPCPWGNRRRKMPRNRRHRRWEESSSSSSSDSSSSSSSSDDERRNHRRCGHCFN